MLTGTPDAEVKTTQAVATVDVMCDALNDARYKPEVQTTSDEALVEKPGAR